MKCLIKILMIRSNSVLIFCLITSISFFQLQNVCLAEDAEELIESDWKIIESKFCTILYHPDVDTERINNKISIRFYDIALDKSRYTSKNKNIEEQLAEKFDRIFQKVERILDMYPRKIHLKIEIYKNQSQLDKKFLELFNQANTKRLISYYVHKYSTIYTAEHAIRQGVLAHELGHAVIDHYFLIPPPEKIKELLTQYVEIHLED